MTCPDRQLDSSLLIEGHVLVVPELCTIHDDLDTVHGPAVAVHEVASPGHTVFLPLHRVAEYIWSRRLEVCAVCGDWRPAPIRLRDSTGQPVCDSCRCECCGQAPDCDCEIDVVGGESRETGPWQETVCFTHHRTAG